VQSPCRLLERFIVAERPVIARSARADSSPHRPCRARFAGRFEADHFAGIVELVRGGFGVSIVLEMTRPLAIGCHPVPINQKAMRRVGFIRPGRRYHQNPMKALIRVLRELARERQA